MIPPAPAALLYKLRTAQSQGLLAPDAALPPPSPCVSVCTMDAQQTYCVGCLRTLDELRAWGSADAATKRAIWQRIRTRCSSSACA